MSTPEPTLSLPEAQLKNIASQSGSPEDKLHAAAASAEAALSSAKTASGLRTAAETIKDPTKRQKYLQDAYQKELEAHGNSKKARMLRSGAFQGSVGGGGIGMAVGAGLGTVVGTLVGTIATIPTTAVGSLVGAGVGGVHGPWIQLKDEKGEGEEKDNGAQQGREKAAEEREKAISGDEGVLDPEALRNAADEVARQRGQVKVKKKKPRKLEVRNKA